VHEERLLSADVELGGIREQLGAGRLAEALAQQEVAIAVHHAKPRARLGEAVEEAGDDRVERFVDVVVADPVLEEIAEHMESIGRRGRALQEIEKALVRFGPILTEVKIGDEERRQTWRFYYLEPTTVIDSITTGLVGTFWCMPLLPVGTPTILLIVSMPSTTLPNTV